MGQIYCIKNLVNGKCYVGQTVRTFEKRYPGGWYRSTKNPGLKAAVQKYGVDSFEVVILADLPNEELNKSELEWSEKMSSYSPNGYNIRQAGENAIWRAPRGDEFRRKVGDSKRGMVVSDETKALKSKKIRCIETGLEFPSTIEAARQMGLRQGHISENINQKRPHVRGFHFERVI